MLSGLRQPVAVVHCGDGSQRLFVLEREGVVRILSHNLELIKEPYLDIHKLVQNGLKVWISLIGAPKAKNQNTSGMVQLSAPM